MFLCVGDDFMRKFLRSILYWIAPELRLLRHSDFSSVNIQSSNCNVTKGKQVRLFPICHLSNVTIGDYTYISFNSQISYTTIGKCCSIGPNFFCGWGIHPLDAISTSPMFYSTLKQNGMSLSTYDKIKERDTITIGNDVFIGANVTVLDGVSIGDGAVIGAGAVVSKDIPPYAIAVGCPIRIIRYRMKEEQIAAMQRIQWWNWTEEQLQDVEQMFYNIDQFIEKYS